jgi:tetratricopeptide (TPR) repeat protein
MQISLHSPARKYLFLTLCALASSWLIWSAALDCAASYFADRADSVNLLRAIGLQPRNAEYQFRLGRYDSLADDGPENAVKALQVATNLNPHKARYWLELASAYQVSGNQEAQLAAMERGIAADPRTPSVAWDAGNLYMVMGYPDKALHEFKLVLDHEPTTASAVLPMCWRVNPKIDTLLNGFLPPNPDVYFAFLDFLVSRKETAAAEKVWNQLASLQQPLRKQRAFEFVHFLLNQQEVEAASEVWQQCAELCGLHEYQPSFDNLVVNPNFDRDVLNAGFDWQYVKLRDVSLALDPSQMHDGHRSLLIDFNAGSLSDAGIRQLIPVHPGMSYEFSGYFKDENLQGSGATRFALIDSYSNELIYASDSLSASDPWKQVRGTFTTGPTTKLLALLVQHVPAEDAIRGKLWISDLRLRQTP